MREATPTIASVLEQMSRVWERHDMEAFGMLFGEDADFVNIFGDWHRGRAEITEDHARRHRTMFRAAKLRIEPPALRHLRSDITLVHWRWTMQDVRTPEGEPVPNKTGLMLQVMEQRDGNWFIVASHNTETRGG